MITQQHLKEYLSYDPETGNFIWIKQKNSRALVGYIAGCPSSTGHLRIRFDKKYYFCHRLVWLYLYNKWPENEIDHIDGNPANNKLSNLRDVIPRINKQNQKKTRFDNACGYTGVIKNKRSGNYVSSIVHLGKKYHLGTYKFPELAYQAYLAKKRELHEGCTI